MEVKIGDWVKVKIGTMSGTIRGWRKVVGVGKQGDNYWCSIRANGYDNFMVKKHEIIDVKPQRPAKTIRLHLTREELKKVEWLMGNVLDYTAKDELETTYGKDQAEIVFSAYDKIREALKKGGHAND